MPTYDYLLLGGGTSCAYAAVAIRRVDNVASLAILGQENEPPYDRPPFTKYFLWNDEKNVDDFHSKDVSFYSENHVELILGKRAVAIERDRQIVRTDDGGEFGYGKLLYALGSEPVRLPVPGAESAWLLRTAEDSVRIRSAAISGARAVLVGGGYIGAELAASLVGRGCHVTLIERGSRVWSRFPSQAAAQAITRELRTKGVELVTNRTVAAIEGNRKVVNDDGASFEGDFVVLGVGATPRTELALRSGLRLGGSGVATNRELRTSDPRVWAAGDVAEYEDAHLGEPYRVEHHLHAKSTAEHCGRGMAGQVEEYRGVPWYFSDVGDLSMNLRGYPERAARSFLVSNTDEPVVTEVFVFADGRIAGVVDVRKDYKAQDPIMELFGELIQKRAVATPVERELSQPGFDVMKLAELATA